MKRTLIAVAVLSSMAGGTAYAEGCTAGCDPADLYTSTNVYTDVGQLGLVFTAGRVNVSNSAGAVVNNTQSATLSGVSLNPPPQSYVSGAVTTTYDAHDYRFNGSANSSSSSAKTGSFSAGFSENSAQASASTESQGHAFTANGSHASNSTSTHSNTSYADSHNGADGSLNAQGSASYTEGNRSISGKLAGSFNAALNQHSTNDSGSTKTAASNSSHGASEQEASAGYSNHASSQAANGSVAAGYTKSKASASQWAKNVFRRRKPDVDHG